LSNGRARHRGSDPELQQIAEAILLLAALFAVYEAYARGGMRA
jgi:hypothetical protein